MKEVNLNNAKYSFSVEEIMRRCAPPVKIEEIAATGGIINSN